MTSESNQLVEHYFRHEYGRLVGVMVRTLGMGQLDLAEDVVQGSLERALKSWSLVGIPEDPGAWLIRTAKNLATDAIRRRNVEIRILRAEAGTGWGVFTDPKLRSSGEIRFAEEIGDESLRLLFLCCHESIPVESRLALALKIVGGFGAAEIARALVTSQANAEKRLARGKERLRQQPSLIDLSRENVRERLDSVLSVVYLIFNEGYSASDSPELILRDLCEEAARLAQMIADHPMCGQPQVFALLALMAFHAARFDARLTAEGSLVLLEHQDRTTWDWRLIRTGIEWMSRSVCGDELSRYHVEAAIAWEHCRAPSIGGTDWRQIVQLYGFLERLNPSPAIRLNRIIAQSHLTGPQTALNQLEALAVDPAVARMNELIIAVGHFLLELEKPAEAKRYFDAALTNPRNAVERAYLINRVDRCVRESKLSRPVAPWKNAKSSSSRD